MTKKKKKKKKKEKPEGLPPLFLARLELIIPPQHLEVVKNSFQRKPFLAFRTQKHDLSTEHILKEMVAYDIKVSPSQVIDGVFVISESEVRKLQETELYKKNQIYIQSLSSMLVPRVLDPQPGERVLDMAAAPGSMSTQMVKRLKGEGHLYANEKIRNRFFKLKANLETQGYENFSVSMQTGEIYGRFHPHFFDRVLLDAPCSNEGRFLIDEPKTYAYWKPIKIKEMVSKQRNLIKSAIKTLRPGGTLVYSTCTYAPEENEKVLDWALKKFGDEITLESFDLKIENQMDGLTEWKERSFSPEVKKAKRILPSETMDAFFIAKIKKTERKI